MKKTAVIILLWGTFFFLWSCKSVEKKNSSERNEIKNLASDSTNVANNFLKQYDFDKALLYYNQALKYNIMTDNSIGAIRTYADIGKVHMLKKEYKQGLEYYNQAFELAREEENIDYFRERAYILNALGEIHYLMEDLTTSADYFNKALKLENQLSKSYNNDETKAMIRLNLAKINRANNQYQAALDELKQSQALLENLFNTNEIEDAKNLSLIYYTIATTYSKMQKYDNAISYIEKALKIDRFIENSSGIADDYYALGMLYRKKNKPDSSIKYFNRSGQIYFILEYLDQFTEIKHLLSEIYFEKKDYLNFYKNKRDEFKLTLDKERKSELAAEIYSLLDDEEKHQDLPGEIIEEIKNIYPRFIKEKETTDE